MLLKILNVFLVDRVLALDAPNNPPIGPVKVLPDNISGVGADNFGGRGGVKDAGQNLADLIKFVFNFAIAIAAGIFVIMLLVGGITYLTGAGNDEQTGKGKKMMIDAVVGIFIVLASWGIGTYILYTFGYR